MIYGALAGFVVLMFGGFLMWAVAGWDAEQKIHEWSKRRNFKRGPKSGRI
jgi:hypothetical protein